MTIECRARREPYWPEVEQFFGELPPHLFRQGLLLKNSLTVRYGESGHLVDILTREEDYPLLAMHFWLLDDLGVPEDQARVQLERHLFLAMFFSFAATYVHESILDRDTFFDDRFLFLEGALTRRATFHLAQLFPQDSPFWLYHGTFWGEYAEAHLWEGQAHVQKQDPSTGSGHDPVGGDDLGRSAARLAPAKLSIAAVALYTGRGKLLPQLLEMVERLNRVFQARREVLSLKRDLFRRNLSYPIVRTMAAAGMDPRAPFAPEQVLGAAVLTGSVKKVCQESLDDLEACRKIARELNLPAWTAYLDTVEAITRELLGLFSFGALGAPAAGRRHTSFIPYQDTLAQVVKMAEGYLLSDLSFRESWEVQRYTVLDMPELTGRAFPSGFTLELLCAHGHDLSAQVDEVFHTLQRCDFRYWENYDVAPDADILGLLLRLHRHSAHKEAHREMLRRPLRWMGSNVLSSGEIRVFFANDIDVSIDAYLVWGNSCISVESNLLLGLIDYDWTQHRSLIERSASSLLDRVLTNGLGGTAHYDSLYALWIVLRLIVQLSARPAGAALRARMAQAGAAMRQRLAWEAKQRTLSPQDAALLILACLDDAAAESLFEPRWITVLLKNQRYDGSWPAEPTYVTPHRGGAAVWYASRTLTTAFCYHALCTYRERRP